MTIHFQRAIDRLKTQVLELSALVEESVVKAVKAFERRDMVMAQSVVNDDDLIDRKEVEVEEECLKIFALHQPVARDLRFIVSVLKINNDLERIGDLAVNIAHSARDMCALKVSSSSDMDFDGAELKVQRMLRQSLDALINLDEQLAGQVCAADDEIDAMYRKMNKKIRTDIQSRPAEAEKLLLYLAVARNLERIGDHTTNIAEDVIYMVSGEIVRHGLYS